MISMNEKTITITINDQIYTRTVNVATTLGEFIRDDIGLTGTKIGCNEGECGACTIIFNGKAINSCIVLAYEAEGGNVLTVEGLAGDELHPLQQAFMDCGAVQCGYCTPGMLLLAKSILDRNHRPSEQEIRKGMEGCICRCTGYNRIIEAILLAAERMYPQ